MTATLHLSALVFGHDVVVEWVKLDRYGRKVGTVRRGDVNANLEQLRAGVAWYYREYDRDVAPNLRPVYVEAEAAAKAARRGLWRDPNPLPPWTFRREPTPTAAPLGLLGAVSAGDVRGNKNSGIYHLPSCPDYNRIAERNRVPFKTEAEAAAAGFRKAGNCP